LKWFKHDSDAAQDAKLRKLIIRYGPTGYAMYFYCLELICGNVSDSNITFELEHDAEIIADGLKVPGTPDKSSVDVVNEIMLYMVSIGLFEESHSRITCTKMAKRLDQSMTSSPRMRSLIATSKKHHDPVMISHARLEETRTEETRTEEKKRTADAVHPSLSVPMNQTRYDNLCRERGQRLVDWAISSRLDWEAANGKPKAKDYAAAAATWIRKAEEFGNLPRFAPAEKRCPECGKQYLGYMCVSCGWEQPA